MPGPAPDGSAAWRPARHAQMPPFVSLCSRTLAGMPAHGYGAWLPGVPIPAGQRIRPPVRSLHFHQARSFALLTNSAKTRRSDSRITSLAAADAVALASDANPQAVVPERLAGALLENITSVSQWVKPRDSYSPIAAVLVSST
jgi:hypothetical protein